MRKRIESDPGEQRARKLPVNLGRDRETLLPGPFEVTNEGKHPSGYELSKKLSEK